MAMQKRDARYKPRQHIKLNSDNSQVCHNTPYLSKHRNEEPGRGSREGEAEFVENVCSYNARVEAVGRDTWEGEQR